MLCLSRVLAGDETGLVHPAPPPSEMPFLLHYLFLDATGRDWGQEEKGTTEDEMAGWHHRLDGHEFE